MQKMITRKQIPTWLGVALILVAIVTIWEVSVVRQNRVLDEAKAKVENLHPDWIEFVESTQGADHLYIGAHTSPLGSIVIGGIVPDEQVTAKATAFAETIDWPRGVSTRLIHEDEALYQSLQN